MGHVIFAADHPLVLDETYDQEGYKPGERRRIEKARARQAKGDTMKHKKKPAVRHVKSTRRTLKASKPTSERARPVVRHRANTIRGNGAPATSREVAPEKVPIGEAMRRAVEELGEVTIDDSLAPQQLRELADCYEDVTRRAAAWFEQSELCKTAKKSMESAKDLLLEKVRTFTHPVSLPLFDQAEREADQADMLDAAGDL